MTKSIHVVASIKCGYWKKRQWVFLILILSRNSIYPNIWFSHPLHYHSSWKIKKTCLKEIILNASYFKNIRQIYKFIVLPQELTYVVKHNSKGKKSYTENEVISMLEFLINNIFVEFGWQFFQQIFDIPMGTNYVPLIADLFSYSYESEFMQKFSWLHQFTKRVGLDQ